MKSTKKKIVAKQSKGRGTRKKKGGKKKEGKENENCAISI